MPFKTILAIVQNEAEAERVVSCAAELASRHDGHLIGLHAEALPIPYTSSIGFPDAEFIQVSSDINKERSTRLGQIFARVTQAAGVRAEWRSLESFSGDSAASGVASARCADLVIAAQTDPDCLVDLIGGQIPFSVDTVTAAIPQLAELNIGHFLVGEAIFTGLEDSVRRMRELMDAARGTEAR